MIKIKRLNKKYVNDNVLSDINLEFKNSGLYFILGPSGCGKTTLLNCLSGLCDYEGSVIYDNADLKLMNSNSADAFRLKNIGFVFQDFKLFMHDDVFNNIITPLLCLTSDDKIYVNKRAEDCLKLVGINHLKNQKINCLSGGEKQRCAIARAIINDPKVLLCDEPTGALDTFNKIEVMKILKTISTSKLVIIVSHDQDLANAFGDFIIHIKDGHISKIENKENKLNKAYLPIFKTKMIYKKPSLPFKFLFKHTKNAIKERKYRSLITNFIVSFGLLGVGLSFIISDTIYQSVIGMYENIMSENQIIVTNQMRQNSNNDIKSIEYIDAIQIATNYPQYTYDIGACYLANFEEFFKECDELVLADSTYRYILHGYSSRSINEFIWLDLCEEILYPSIIDNLENDEIIVSLDPFQINDLCYNLRIEKSIESLSNYINQNGLKVVFEFSNPNWQYHDEQILTIRGFTISNVPTIYHSNHLWNEYMYETQMRFPINLNVSQPEYYPWVMKKIFYLHINNVEEFLYKTKQDDILSSYIFEIANEKYYPWLYAETRSYDINRILVFNGIENLIDTSDWKYFKKIFNDIGNPIFSTSGGYAVYGTNLLSGFNKVMFFSSQIETLEEITGVFASNGYDPLASIDMPKYILQGHYSKTSKDGVFFKGINNETLKGTWPSSLKEIVISSKISKSLFGDKNPIGQKIFIASTSYTYESESHFYDMFFSMCELVITGVIHEDLNILYHDEFWTILFFQFILGISAFELLPVGMSFEINNDMDQEIVVKELSRQFPHYNFDNPMKEISDQANQLCNYLQIILLALSGVTFLIAICIMSICNYLHVLEIKKDIGLIRCLGINKKESINILYFHSLFISLMGAITSCIELFVFYLLSRLGINRFFGLNLNFKFNLLPYIVIIVISLFIGIFPAFFVSFKMKKLNPIDALKN